jgi:ribonucleoside-diphosphate reductase alpha chain
MEMTIDTEQKTAKSTPWGLSRCFTVAGQSVWDTVNWTLREAKVSGMNGEVIFCQENVEFPESWSQTAVNVVSNKYFRGALGSPEREHSVKQLIGRVANTAADWGIKDGYFKDSDEAQIFRDELTYILLHQHAAFNSPVWFNMGVDEVPQVSACFINEVKDEMGDIMDLAKTEAMLFKGGSGAGCNLSTIRSSREFLKGGGEASGPISFMRGFDAFAGVIKSGGKTRRAAKMVMLDSDHPDILEFIRSKKLEEQKAWSLIDAGYDGGFNVPGGAYDSVFFQNANHSVRVSDEFMQAVISDSTYSTKAVVDGAEVDNLKAKDVLMEISEGTHVCGDPGMQYDSTINDWHTCSNSDRIYGSNPCSEYMFLNSTACNLASLNLMKFREADGSFNVERFESACETVFMAQEIFVDSASYPTPLIGENSRKYRPLGLGFANIGALLMSKGMAYDSEQGRAYTGAITALMCGAAYRTSARMAQRMGAFEAFDYNAEPMMKVMGNHRAAVDGLDSAYAPADMVASAKVAWDEVIELGDKTGLRNAQATVLAPTGTIAFMMDCDTTGVEPDIALVKYKKLVGGGLMKLVNGTVEMALTELNYSAEAVARILAHIDATDTIEGAKDLKDQHLPIFDCAFKAANGERSISPMGHLRMMGAAQPFLSGAISKTVNMPEDCTVQQIFDAYVEAWRLGIKAVAIYRDNSKRTQPLNTSVESKPKEQAAVQAVSKPRRRRLADTRSSITHKFSIGGNEGYLTVGLYEDGTPGEVFTVMAKEGSVVSGLIDGFSTMTSLALQYGVPLDVMVRKFSHTRFEPSGFTGNKEIPMAKSVLDYMFRWLDNQFHAPVPASEQALQQNLPGTAPVPEQINFGAIKPVEAATGPMCSSGCGPTVPNGGCYICSSCGSTTGCG